MMPVKRNQNWLPNIFNDFFDNDWMVKANATAPAINVLETEKEYNVDSFNSKFKTLYYGSTDGFFMNNFLDTVIKSNEENPEHIITVNFADTETNDASELRKMKKKFSKGTTYEIIYEYDENGLINKAIIEK